MANYTIWEIEQAYIAFFGRPAEPAGADYWLLHSNDLKLGDLYREFAQSKEYRDQYAAYLEVVGGKYVIKAGSEEAIVNVAYQHLFGHDADAAGKAYWANDIKQGWITFDNLLLQLEGGAKDTVGGNQDLTTITQKTLAAEAFTAEVRLVGDGNGYTGDASNLEAHQWLSGIHTAAEEVAATQNAALYAEVSKVVALGAHDSGVTHWLSSTNPIIDVGPNDVVIADSHDFTPGTNIHGTGSGTVNITFDTSTSGIFDGQSISAVSDINIDTHGGHTISTTNWTDIGPNTISITGTGFIHLTDLQQAFNDWDTSTSSFGDNYAINDFVDASGLVWLSFDVQAVDTTSTIVDLSVREVTSAIVIDSAVGQSIENLNLHITDTLAHASTIASLHVQGINTLNIDGGIAGQTFKIVADLDAGLKVIDAHNAVANLDLSVASSNVDATLPGDWSVAQSITLGSGDDIIRFGDTLGDSVASHQDSIYGGAGKDKLTAIFTTGGTRTPVTTGVETFELTFNSSATVNFNQTVGVQTVNVLESPLFGASLIHLQSSTTAINLTGKQTGFWDVLYGGTGILGTGPVGVLDFTWTDNSKGANPHIAQLRFDNVQSLNFVKDGTQDDFVGTSIFTPTLLAPGFSVDGQVTQILTFDVKGLGNLSVYGPHIAIGGVTVAYINALDVTQLTFTTENNGDLIVNGGDATHIGVIATEQLENLYVHASAAGNIHVGSLAFSSFIDHVDVKTLGANINIDAIFGYDIPSYVQGSLIPVAVSGSTVSNFHVETAGNNGEHIWIGLIAAQDIQTFDIVAGRDSVIDVSHAGLAVAGLHGIWLTNGLGTLTAKGEGIVNEVDLSFESFSTINFSGLTNSNALVWYDNSHNDVTFIGTNNGDHVWAGQGNQTVTTGTGADIVHISDLNHATNIITTGAGVDFVHLSALNSIDRVSVGGTAVLATDGTTANTDTIENFHGLGQDTIVWGVGGTGSFAEHDVLGLTYAAALLHADSGVMVGKIYDYEVNTAVFGEAWLFKDTTAVLDGHPDLVIHLVGTAAHPINNTTVFGGDIVA